MTSRDGDPATWGRHARHVSVEPLTEREAARVLLDWAPEAGSENDAQQLARRLGRLPLALGLAGSYLRSDVALRGTFSAYQRTLDADNDGSRLVALVPSDYPDDRTAVMRTWELSLDALAQRGVPQARILLRLLSCYAASTPIPLDLLDPVRLGPFLGDGANRPQAERRLQDGLRSLRRLRLVDASPLAGGQRAVSLHPLIAETNRARLANPDRHADAESVWQTAVALAAADISWDDNEKPATWGRRQLLAAHLQALLAGAVPHLDARHAGMLGVATACTASGLDRSGAVLAAVRLTRAASALLHTLEDDDPAALHLRHVQAWQLAVHGQPAKAEAIFREVLTRRQRVLGPNDRQTLTTANELAWVAALQGWLAEAESGYRDVVEQRTRAFGAEDHDTLISRHELAWVIAGQDRGEEAEAILEGVLRARSRLLGEDHPRTLACRHELAWTLAKQHRWREAEATYRDVLAARRRILGHDHPDTLTTAQELAWTRAMQGRHRQAIAGYQAVLAARERVQGPQHPDTSATRQALERLRAGHTTTAWHIA